ncbi:hypothetical protein ORV05_03445 [Amycolatopsis cynarae]|uniref:Lipoprotein n=1 Tax=Amycolatopsis cynarae TaxID=2995223 RepID=A0ABY7B4L1_9PSEU|nr:hypothetical protein [Amycolatopsis sp. HUAS 11-8]WAL66875.1 hypothetical protein ORV05_03445 [Amycolatopsis sp. HUAS 11-8]
MRPRTRLRTALLPALLLTLTVAACGGSGDGSGIATAGGTATATPSGTSTGSDQDKMLKFVRCMRENGVNVADPVDGQPPVITEGMATKEQMRTAQEKCKQYAPTITGNGKTVDPETQEQLRKVAQCMRENGFPNFPDPTDKGLAFDEKSGINPQDPKFVAAQQKCDQYAPQHGTGTVGAQPGGNG